MTHRLALIPGDGVGPEVIEQALKVEEAVSRSHRIDFQLTEFDLGAKHYLATGETLTDEDLGRLAQHDAILLGAVGSPSVAPGILERGLLLRLRFDLDLYVNLRPVKLYPGVTSPILGLTPERCNLEVVRENTEGLYVGAGREAAMGTADEVAIQESVNTRRGVERVVRYAFGRAMLRRRRLTLCHKTNVLNYAGDLWMRTFGEVASEFPEVTTDYVHVDAACLYLINSPERFDVIVTDNMFGDILTDLGAAIQGGLGLAASANLNPLREHPSMFEPVHGSAPDIAGKDLANPIGAILSFGLCLDHLGEEAAAEAVEAAAASLLEERGAQGTTGMTTSQVGEEVAGRVA
ncbi:MAG TPA: 3-isopropylmalate dehydrogenase [Acidimicrobiia bacterium]|jgi:3-isopropylmalate dehydrogenase